MGNEMRTWLMVDYSRRFWKEMLVEMYPVFASEVRDGNKSGKRIQTTERKIKNTDQRTNKSTEHEVL